MLGIQQFREGIPEVRAWCRKDVREISQGSHTSFARSRITNVQDHAGRDGSGGILPIPLLRTILTGPHDHVGDVLRVGDITRGEQAHFGKRIEP